MPVGRRSFSAQMGGAYLVSSGSVMVSQTVSTNQMRCPWTRSVQLQARLEHRRSVVPSVSPSPSAGSQEDKIHCSRFISALIVNSSFNKTLLKFKNPFFKWYQRGKTLFLSNRGKKSVPIAPFGHKFFDKKTFHNLSSFMFGGHSDIICE